MKFPSLKIRLIVCAAAAGSIFVLIPSAFAEVNVVPQNVSLTPNGLKYFGATTKYTVTSVHTDPNTLAQFQLATVGLLVNSNTDLTDSTNPKLYAYFNTTTMHFFLCTKTGTCVDAGMDNGPGETDVSNTWVTLYKETTASVTPDGKTWTVTWVFSVFPAAWNENANAYLDSDDRMGSSTGWQNFANYYIDSSVPTINTLSADNVLFAGSPKSATVTEEAVDILASAQDSQSGIDYVEITDMNNVPFPSPFRPRFTGIGGNQFQYTNLSLQYNHIRNTVTFSAVDKGGNHTDETVTIVYYPGSQLDVQTVSYQTGAKLPAQSTLLGELPSDTVSFDTIVTNTGAKGIMCTYFHNTDFTDPRLNVLESTITHINEGPIMAQRAGHTGDLEQYSVRCEGKIKSSEAGQHLFYVDAGRYDSIRMFVDDLAVPKINYTYTVTAADPSPTNGGSVGYHFGGALSNPFTLERSKWYSIIVEYQALSGAADPYDTDYLVVHWMEPRCVNQPIALCSRMLFDENLAFSSGGITTFTKDIDVDVTLPPAFEYNTNSAHYFTIGQGGSGTPKEPTVTPSQISSLVPSQELTWRLTDDLPVTESVRYNFTAKLKQL